MVEVFERRGELRCVISSEEDAWEVLRRANSGEFGNRTVHPQFRGWPKFPIKFWVDNDKRVLTAPMMEGLLSFQKSLNRAFLLIEENTTNLRSLSEEERRAQELRFKINSGSTEADPDLIEVAKEFAKSAGAHMNGVEVTIVLLVAVLLWASVSAFKAWLDAKTKTAQDETSSANIKEALQVGRVASAADVERMALMVRAIEAFTGSQALIETGDEGKQGLIRAASKVDDTEIAGVKVSPEVAKRIARHTRSDPSREEMIDTFRVVRTDPEHAEGFRVRIRNETTGEEFFTGLRDALISESDRKTIAAAEWDHSAFRARVAVLRHRGEITSAEIVAVIALDSEEDVD